MNLSKRYGSGRSYGARSSSQVRALKQRYARNWSKEQNLHLAHKAADRAGAAQKEYRRLLDVAIAKYGHPSGGGYTSGVYNPAFPETIKAQLRHQLARMSSWSDAAQAHYAATGKRTPWYATSLKRWSHYME